MKLSEYLKINELTHRQAASEIGVTPVVISLWVTGKSIPNRTNIKKIGVWSGGEVKGSDWY